MSCVDKTHHVRLREAARILGVSVGTLRTERDRGRLVLWRVAGRDWVSLEEVDRLRREMSERP
jgi:hypothetical protein